MKQRLSLAVGWPLAVLISLTVGLLLEVASRTA
jgi:hypothetical protein